MLASLVQNLFGTANDRILSRINKSVTAINALEAEIEALDDAALTARTEAFRQRLKAGESLEQILPEAFATVREAARRTLGQRHFDVQLTGGMVLHEGRIAEMKTGEGKTLVSTLAAYLNALEGKGVHIVTVNDYLAKRDSRWMGQVFGFLGLTVGLIQHGMSDDERRAAYACDITYGTNNELGFDYLRDNMKFRLEDMVQRPFNFAIVDEVDSILIDEARTPLIISGPAQDSSASYVAVNNVMPRLQDGDYEVDEKMKSVALTDQGVERMEQALRETQVIESGGLYDLENMSTLHHVNQALRAHTLFTRDVDYVVNEGKVVIVDEFTGRMMPGRRYSDGLHQALEAKEGVNIQQENQTLASITFQNFFRLYPKLSGMTGTAMTEATELADIYGLEVVSIPTNKPVARLDHQDLIYRTPDEKYEAMMKEIAACSEKGQPVLVGTTSIENSELISNFLKKNKVAHKVLNARQHESEAAIIANAGMPGAVTIATNMAGRGTDIQLGGNLDMRLSIALDGVQDENKQREITEKITAEVLADREKVVAAGGLMVVGMERHESRRIDNQLRGRAGRQGDPGASRFYISLQDDLMRIFGAERIDGLMKSLGKPGEPIQAGMVTAAVERAQKKVEAQNYEVRKTLLKFDDVMNDQRKVIYEQRREIMNETDVAETIRDMRHEVVDSVVTRAIPPKAYPEHWDLDGLATECRRLFGMDVPVHDWAEEDGIADEEIKDRLRDLVDRHMAEKTANVTEKVMRHLERSLLLQLLDQSWKDHLSQLDHLRQGISLRAYGQRDPLNEYKREAFELFEDMLDRLRENVTGVLCNMEVRAEDAAQLEERRKREAEAQARAAQARHEQAAAASPMAATGTGGMPAPGPQSRAGGATATVVPITTRKSADEIDPANPETWGKVQRNAPCPCGSGKKYKQCHGRLS